MPLKASCDKTLMEVRDISGLFIKVAHCQPQVLHSDRCFYFIISIDSRSIEPMTERTREL